MTETPFPKGGYKGSFSLGQYYAPGSIIKQGPFLFGTSTGAHVNPCVVESDLGGAGWSIFGNASQTGSTVVLVNNATSQSSAALSDSVNSGWDQKRLIVDALVGPNGGADALQIGIYDASLGDPTVNQGLELVSGFYGITVDIWNNQVETCSNGTVANASGYNTSFENYQAPIETTRYFRYILDMVENGANWDLVLSRTMYDGGTGTGANSRDNPGRIASWSITKPSFTSWRFALGGWSGGVASTLKARNAYIMDISGDWDVLSVLPHTPEIEAGFW